MIRTMGIAFLLFVQELVRGLAMKFRNQLPIALPTSLGTVKQCAFCLSRPKNVTDGLTEKEGSTGHQLLKSDLLLGIF